MMNTRPQAGDGDKRWYCPDRDILYLQVQMIRAALKQSEDKALPEVSWLRANAPDSNLGASAVALAKFFTLAKDGDIPASEVLKQCGFEDLPMNERLVIGYLTFHITMRFYVAFLRDVTVDKVAPVDFSRMYNDVMRIEEMAKWGPVRRWIYRKWQSIRRCMRVMSQSDVSPGDERSC